MMDDDEGIAGACEHIQLLRQIFSMARVLSKAVQRRAICSQGQMNFAALMECRGRSPQLVYANITSVKSTSRG